MDPALYAPLGQGTFAQLIGAPLAGLLLVAAFGMAHDAMLRTTHALVVDLPQPALHKSRYAGATYRIGVTGEGRPTLDGRSMSLAQITRRLRHLETTSADFALIFQPDGDATYGDSVRVLKALWDVGATTGRFCFGGLGQHAQFHKVSGLRPDASSPPLSPSVRACDWDSITPPEPGP